MIFLIKLIIIGFVLSEMGAFVGDVFFELVNDKLNVFVKLIISTLAYIMSCPKCFTFWLSIIMSGDIFVACVAALSVDLLKKIEYKLWGKKTEL